MNSGRMRKRKQKERMSSKPLKKQPRAVADRRSVVGVSPDPLITDIRTPSHNSYHPDKLEREGGLLHTYIQIRIRRLKHSRKHILAPAQFTPFFCFYFTIFWPLFNGNCLNYPDNVMYFTYIIKEVTNVCIDKNILPFLEAYRENSRVSVCMYMYSIRTNVQYL